MLTWQPITSLTEQRLQLLWSQQRKKDHVPNRLCPGEQHGEPIDSNADAASRGHAVLECEKKFLVNLLSLFAGLFRQTLALGIRVVQFAVARRNLGAVNNQFENIDERVVRCVLFRQRYQLF